MPFPERKTGSKPGRTDPVDETDLDGVGEALVDLAALSRSVRDPIGRLDYPL